MNAYFGTFGFLLFPLGVVAALSAPGEARACTFAFQPHPATASFPSGSSYPSNATFFFDGDFPGDGGVEAVEVTVDGFPARLVSTKSDNEGFGKVSRDHLSSEGRFRVVPEPRAGQRVTIRGADCEYGESSGECPVVEFKFTATAPDKTPPAVPSLSYDIQEYASIDAMCGKRLEPRVFAHVAPPLEGGAAAPVSYLIEQFADEAMTKVVGTAHATSLGAQFDAALDADTKCVRVWTYDFAGNDAAAATTDCALPALPSPPAGAAGGPEPKGLEPVSPGGPPAANADKFGCHVSAATGGVAAPWAALLAASALALGGLRRRLVRR